VARRIPFLLLALALAGCAIGQTEPAGEAGQVGSRVKIEILDQPEDAVDDQATSPSPVAPPTATVSVVAEATVPEVVARSEPSEDAAPVSTLANPTMSGSPLVFRAVDEQSAPAGWLQVHLPVQPNGTTGWIRREDVELSSNPYRIEVDRATHSLRVYNLDDLWIETAIAVGTGATPTPVGEFYLLELLRPPNPDGDYGPYAFGLSGFSEVLESFGEAETAIIGLHGTNDPSSIGTDVSAGCIRLPNDVIETMALTIPLGTPIVIT
jgi:lipoprotein-anchoring transpeptidase ErfK/SrfK